MFRNLAISALLVGIFFYWRQQPDEKPQRTDPQNTIEIYTTSFCGECKRAKAYMDKRHIQYVELDVERDIDLRREFYARGGKGTPLIYVYGKKMEGFNSKRFEELLARR